MHLYLVHCGFYDPELEGGVYESHTNFFVVAESFQDAKAKAKQTERYKEKRMHVDSLQQVERVGGHRVLLERDAAAGEGNRIITKGYEG